MNKTDLNILMLEDEPMDVELNKEQLLLLEEYNCKVNVITDRKSYIEALETSSPDIIICDYNLPQYNGTEALKDLKERNPLIPFIFVAGTMKEEVVADAIKAGAWDYVVKDRLFRLPLVIKSALKLKVEKELALESEKEMRRLIMAIDETSTQIVVTDVKGNVQYANKRFTEVTGYQPDDIVGKSLLISHPDHEESETIKEALEKITKGEIYRGEFLSYKKDGTGYWEMVSITPIKNPQGEIINYVMVREDITERKIMEQELIKARNKAEKSDELKDIFLQNLSHEIRTPMNAIVGFSNLMMEHTSADPDNDLKYFSSVILKSSEQLLSIVSDILTISKIDAGHEEITKRTVDLDRLFDELAAIYSSRAENKDLAFVTRKGTSSETFKIVTDETKLTQILTNLLDNAIKFTSEGSIELGYMVQKDTVTFTIKDTGRGITKEAQGWIFERFRQADPSVSIDYGGTGLGLSISKSYAEMLGGDIQVSSEPGKGSEFSLIIPYAYEDTTKQIDEQGDITLKKKSLTILIAEDEKYNYILLEALFDSNDIALIRAKDGVEALEILRKNSSINLILMDIKMPIMDGIECFQEIRKMNLNMPVIALTAYALEHDHQKIMELGFDEYITKPINKNSLFKKINSLI